MNKYLTDEPDKVGLGEFNQRDLIGASFIQNGDAGKASSGLHTPTNKVANATKIVAPAAKTFSAVGKLCLYSNIISRRDSASKERACSPGNSWNLSHSNGWKCVRNFVKMSRFCECFVFWMGTFVKEIKGMDQVAQAGPPHPLRGPCFGDGFPPDSLLRHPPSPPISNELNLANYRNYRGTASFCSMIYFPCLTRFMPDLVVICPQSRRPRGSTIKPTTRLVSPWRRWRTRYSSLNGDWTAAWPPSTTPSPGRFRRASTTWAGELPSFLFSWYFFFPVFDFFVVWANSDQRLPTATWPTMCLPVLPWGQ